MRTKLIIATVAAGFILSLGSAEARTVPCNNEWQPDGHVQKKCYFLPTVSNGRVTGLQEHDDVRRNPPHPGAIIGGATQTGWHGGRSR